MIYIIALVMIIFLAVWIFGTILDKENVLIPISILVLMTIALFVVGISDFNEDIFNSKKEIIDTQIDTFIIDKGAENIKPEIETYLNGIKFEKDLKINDLKIDIDEIVSSSGRNKKYVTVKFNYSRTGISLNYEKNIIYIENNGQRELIY